ncbi:hypothetical protein BDY19DRAFT_998837 [Irpex rosettiformis]|uniref:Uncharacterized protein n=1 Tax=Irpex rosettiformis TaxID=378272 RepID=A0ACB8TM94_9APHY|nr:hypothetical protein BDY19DRAFT_998837 [Irpex rosettiformis]
MTGPHFCTYKPAGLHSEVSRFYLLFSHLLLHSRTLCAVLKSLSTPTMLRTNPHVAREICLQRRLPKSFDDAVQARRDLGEPHLFTEKELDAVVSYVSRRPHFNPYGTPSTFNYKKHNARIAAANSHYHTEREKTLLERIEHLSLRDRISVPVASTSTTPIVEKHSTIIDFKKLSEKDLIGIFKPKLEATIKRLNIVVKILDNPLYIVSHRAHRKVIGVHKFFKQTLEDLDHYISTTRHSDLQDLNYGLQALGNISFKSLRKNLCRVVDDIILFITISFSAHTPENDCHGYVHWFDTTSCTDKHFDSDTNVEQDCTKQPCPERYENPLEVLRNHEERCELHQFISLPPPTDDEEQLLIEVEPKAFHTPPNEETPLEPIPPSASIMAQQLHPDIVAAIGAAVAAAMQNMPVPQVIVQPAPAPAVTLNTTDVVKPDKYKGEKGRDLERFLSQCEAYWVTANITDEHQKVLTTLGLMQEKAAQWAIMITDHMAQNNGALHTDVDDWTKLKAQLIKFFGDATPEDTAIIELDKLCNLEKKERDKCNVASYITDFQSYIARI